MRNIIAVVAVALVAGYASMYGTLKAAAEQCRKDGYFMLVGGERIQCQPSAGIKEQS